MAFEPESGRFTAQLVPGASVSKQRVEALILAHGQARSEPYELLWQTDARAEGPAQVTAQPFTLPLLGGGELDFGQIAGQKPAVLVFWASWCAPCIAEAPHLVRLHGQYGERVEFVSVVVDDARTQERLSAVVKQLALTYPVALDPKGQVLQQFGGVSVPLTLVFDASGALVVRRDNFEEGDEGELEAALRRAVE